MTRIIVFILLALTPSAAISLAGEVREATFAVACYDVGAAALEQQKGVLSVEKGWQGFQEINRVHYDSSQTDIDQLATRLKVADTYRATLNQESAGEK